MNDLEYLEECVRDLQAELREARNECPYWSDGKHCYVTMAMVDGVFSQRYEAKRCACGAEVKPR